MNKTTARRYLLSKPASREDFPFGEEVAVFKVRDIFAAVIPGYHMNKKHWNTVILDGSIPVGEIERMIDHSYALVVKGLPKKIRIALEIEFGPETLYRGLMTG